LGLQKGVGLAGGQASSVEALELDGRRGENAHDLIERVGAAGFEKQGDFGNQCAILRDGGLTGGFAGGTNAGVEKEFELSAGGGVGQHDGAEGRLGNGLVPGACAGEGFANGLANRVVVKKQLAHLPV
jgi:hypothetical protein